jgi:hypothetical protein
MNETSLGAGVGEVLTTPFAPEEVLAGTIAVLRHSLPELVAFTPVIRLGELEHRAAPKPCPGRPDHWLRAPGGRYRQSYPAGWGRHSP